MAQITDTLTLLWQHDQCKSPRVWLIVSLFLLKLSSPQVLSELTHFLQHTYSYFCHIDLNCNSITQQVSNSLPLNTFLHNNKEQAFFWELREHYSLNITPAYQNTMTRTLFCIHTTIHRWTCFLWIPNDNRYFYLVLTVLLVSLFPFWL